MVLPPSVADDAPGPDVPVWLRRLSVILGLSRAGVLVLVDHARLERLGELVRALLPAHPELEVHSEARRLVEAEPGSTLVLVPRAEDADWLNINRPLFAARSLRVVLFSPRETTVALAQRAVDFIDWISHRLECPPGPVPFAVAGLRRALAIRAPGVVWKGGDLEVAFRAARPRRKLRRISASRPYEELVAEARAAHGDWLAWTDVDGDFRLRRVRWALAEARRRARTILVEPTVSSPGWWEAHGCLKEFPAARERLERVGARHPGRLAALVDLEPEAVELLGVLLEQGMPEQAFEMEARQGPDGGVVTGRLAVARRLIPEKRLVRGQAPAPTMRAFSENGARVRHLREVEVEAVVQKARAGDSLETEEVAWWAASTTKAFPLLGDTAGLGWRGEMIEVWLRRQPLTVEAWEQVSYEAEIAGDWAVSEEWARRASELAPHSTVSLARLAEAVERQGRYKEAEELLRQVLATQEQTVGVAHPDYAASMYELARVLERQGRYKEAEELLRQVLATQEQTLGVAHPDYAASMYELAWVLGLQGRYKEAEELLRQVLATEEKALGAAHPYRALSLRELARVLERQGRYKDGEGLLRQSLILEESALGMAHPDLCSTLTLLGFVLARQGRPQEGAPLLRRAVEIALTTWGLNHLETAQALHRLAQVQATLKEKEAATTAQQAVDAFLHSLGPEHPMTQQALPELNRILEDRR